MTFPTEQQHFDAVRAVLDAAGARPYDYDESPIEADYTRMTVTDRYGGVPHMSGQIGVRLARITVLAVGSKASNVREIRRRADAALREQSIAVGSHKTTPIQFETAEPVSPDGGELSTGSWYSAASTYTYEV